MERIMTVTIAKLVASPVNPETAAANNRMAINGSMSRFVIFSNTRRCGVGATTWGST
jgi:hypothetical protein